ncbi:MAG TPA: RDD family protein [Acidimicrobiales bacterium]|nr:RDD family protein [Acidimicrobiales bacterium]
MPHCSNCGTEELVDQKFCSVCGTPTSLAPGVETPLPYFPMDAVRPTTIDDLAGFWWRVLAYFVDGVILLVVVAAPLRGLHLTYYATQILNVLAAYFYVSLFIGLRGGQTIGMMIVRIRCVNAADEGPVTLQQAFRRTALYCVLLLIGSLYRVHTYVDPSTLQTKSYANQVLIFWALLVPYSLDLLWAAWDKKNQTLHDRFAKTIVIRPSRVLI